MQSYRDLIVWQKADQLALAVYALTQSFPKQEIFGLTSQLRRAALSVPTNIVEGHGRKSRKEFEHILDIALGSLAEVDYLLFFSERLGCLEGGFNLCRAFIGDTEKLIWKFKKSLQRPR